MSKSSLGFELSFYQINIIMWVFLLFQNCKFLSHNTLNILTVFLKYRLGGKPTFLLISVLCHLILSSGTPVGISWEGGSG